MKKKGLFIALISVMVVMSIVACTPPQVIPKAGTEAGVYCYTDISGKESLIILGAGGRFMLSEDNSLIIGEYALNENNGELVFSYKKEENSSLAEDGEKKASYYGNAIVMDEKRFVKMISHKVTFVLGGDDADIVTYTGSGRTVKMPSDPVRDGHIFLGWYKDDVTFSTPFAPTDTIDADTRIYARWHTGQTNAAKEFIIGFDAMYANAPHYSEASTIGGKLYNAPTAAREGYRFLGWWISFCGEENKLTKKWTQDTVFEESTTLFAQWQSTTAPARKLSAPMVQVTESGAIWDIISGSLRNYRVQIEGPVGFESIDTTQTGTTKSFLTDTSPIGDYIVRVTANAAVEQDSSDTTVRHYRHKGLNKVSLFTVIEPCVLLFSPVKNAENYRISTDCADPLHDHTDYDNGDLLSYNFANCTMKSGGITFYVTAEAEGFVPSTGIFVYNKQLDKISEDSFYVDENQNVYWDAVPYATNYIVSVLCADGGHKGYHSAVDNSTRTSFSVKECPAGEITVSVTPTTKGYNSLGTSSHTFTKTRLATPSGIRVGSNDITWTACTEQGVTGYTVTVGGLTLTSGTNSLMWPSSLSGDYYEVIVQTNGETSAADSIDSDPVPVVRTMHELSYAKSTVLWDYVLSAAGYNIMLNGVMLNGEDEQPLVITENKYTLRLNQAGINTVQVGIAGSETEAFKEIQVFAYTLTLKDDDAEYKQYYASGDIVNLPVQESGGLDKEGYGFAGWYSAKINGKRFTDAFYPALTDITLYAAWTRVTYDIVLDYCLAETEENGGAEIRYLSSYTLELPYRDGGGFVGWFTEKDGKGQRLTNEEGESYDVWTYSNADGMTLYAHWVDIFKFIKLSSGAYANTYMIQAGDDITEVTQLVIPATYKGANVTTIAAYAFYELNNVVSVSIPDTIKIIDTGAFRNCYNLVSIDVATSNSAYKSEDGVLFDKGNKDLSGNDLISLIHYPMAKPTTAYTVPEKVTTIETYAFAGCSHLSSVSIPDSVTNIGARAFEGCSGMESIKLPSALTGINLYTFSGCTRLRSIVIPGNVSDIGPYAFNGCSNLTKVTFAKATFPLDSNFEFDMGDNAFKGCLRLSEIFFEAGSGIEKIGSNAFSGCNNLRTITLSLSIKTVGANAFFGSNNITIYSEFASAPAGWSKSWNSSNRPVVWGCMLSSDKTYVASYTKAAITNPSSSALSAPNRNGYTFKEWNTSADGSGTAYTAAKLSDLATGTTVYSIWTAK